MTIPNASEDEEKLDHAYTPKKNRLNVQLPYDLPRVLMVTYPREIKAYVYTKTYTWMFFYQLYL